jgi:dimethylamine monooxygenase subunit B
MISAGPLSLRVRRVDLLAPTLRRVVLEAADGGLLPTSMPGAHLVLNLPDGERLRRNAYSVVSHPGHRDRYEIIVRRTPDSRGGSAHVHERLAAGDIIEATAPSSLFPIQSHARKHLLIGGGIGITPMLSFLPVLRERGLRVEMHQFARAGEAALFAELLAPFGDHAVHVHASRADCPLDALLERQPLGTHAYVCGPAPLIDAVRDSAVALGWPLSHVHSESFGAYGGAPFTVRLARSGRTIAVGEHDSMLEALEAAGVPMASLCRGGACGECLTQVVDGTPEHRDHFLSPQDRASGRFIMPCVSRAETAMLTIDK